MVLCTWTDLEHGFLVENGPFWFIAPVQPQLTSLLDMYHVHKEYSLAIMCNRVSGTWCSLATGPSQLALAFTAMP